MNQINLDLNGKPHVLTADDSHALAALVSQPGWEVLLEILAGIEAGTRTMLEDSGTELDMVRALQGRLSVSKDLIQLLCKEVPKAISAMRKDPDA